jgi:hypothetical protein
LEIADPAGPPVPFPNKRSRPAQGTTSSLLCAYFFLAALLAAPLPAFLAAAAFGLGIVFGLHSRERVVATLPQLSQK